MEMILSFLLFLPLAGSFIIGLLPKEGAQTSARFSAVTTAILMCLVSSVLAFKFDPAVPGMQFEFASKWFDKPFPVEYHVGVDGMSLCLVLLTSFVTLMAVLASQKIGQTRPKLYYSMLMLLTTSIVGVFVSLDLLQFFVLFELELVPMYFLIAIWGGPNRDYAAMKFLLYTFFAGALMLGGILLLTYQLWQGGVEPHTFNMIEIAKQTPLLMKQWQSLACLMIGLAFLIKLPCFPFHTWLPDAHVEAPTPVSMILAALLLKMGSYGLIRICLSFFPTVVAEWGPYLVLLGAFNIVWAAVACLIQKDMKRIIAFSSVSHMGFVTMGIGALSAASLNGAIFQMIAHGFISAALFFLVGTVYDRVHTRDLDEIGGGLAKEMPFSFYFWMLAAMANLGLPGLAGFVAEAAVFYGTITSPMATSGPDPTMVRVAIVFSAIGVILTAGYMLNLLRRLFYGPEQTKWKGHLWDLNYTEKFVAAALSVFIILLGVYPLMVSRAYQPYSDSMAKSVAERIPEANPSVTQ